MEPVIEVRNLRKTYGTKVAVADVSLTIERGEIFGILWPNGAGKTTTVECLAGLRHADGGTVRLLGADPQRNPAAVREGLGIQLQESKLPPKLRVIEALRLYATFYADPADPEELLELLGLQEKRDTPFADLSGGQQQRLSIALALVGNPEVAILDELTTGLDPQARRDTWDLIERVRDSGVTIVLVTHFMDEAERLADRLALVDAGRIVALDTPTGLVERAGQQQRVRFRPSAPLEDRLLTALPEVTAVERSGPQLVVTGTGNLLHAVTSTLARNQVIAEDLRVEQASLDDAFVTLTSHNSDN